MLLKLYHHCRDQSENCIGHDKQPYRHYEVVLEDCHDRLLVAKFRVLEKRITNNSVFFSIEKKNISLTKWIFIIS